METGKPSQQLMHELTTLREDTEKLRALLDALPVGVSILGKDRKPLYTNPTLGRILGLSPDELREGKYEQRTYLRADGSEMPAIEFPSALAFEEKKATGDMEIGVVTESGGTLWTMVSAVYLEQGDWRVVLTVADITRQKNAENTLQNRTEELVERVKELNCLYGISDLVEKPGIKLDEIFQGTVNLIPPSWHYPGQTSARIVHEDQEYTSTGFRASNWKQGYEIFVHGKHWGEVEVFFTGEADRDSNPFLKEEYTLLRAVAERLGRIIERFQAEQQLVELATTDPLTGLYNRRHFFELAQQEVERSKRYGHSLACIMFDIDYFKEINDSYGHLFGDKVLKGAVLRCQETIRQVDIFARYGGDEFIILLPETGLERGKQLADRLRADFIDRALEIGEKIVPISLSLGLASITGDSTLALDTLLNCADTALYEAKKKGRNQVAVCEKPKSD